MKNLTGKVWLIAKSSIPTDTFVGSLVCTENQAKSSKRRQHTNGTIILFLSFTSKKLIAIIKRVYSWLNTKESLCNFFPFWGKKCFGKKTLLKLKQMHYGFPIQKKKKRLAYCEHTSACWPRGRGVTFHSEKPLSHSDFQVSQSLHPGGLAEPKIAIFL